MFDHVFTLNGEYMFDTLGPLKEGIDIFDLKICVFVDHY